MDTKGQMLKKITVRDVMGNKPGLLPAVSDMLNKGVKGENPAPVALCRILGVVNKAKPGFAKATETEFVRFVGEFVAINLITGQRFASGAAILPGAAENAIYGSLGQLNDKGQAERVVEFGLEISVSFDAKAATQYVYQVASLVEARASAPLQSLLERAGVDKALPAPAAETNQGSAPTAVASGGSAQAPGAARRR